MTLSEFLIFIAWACVVFGGLIAIVMYRKFEMTKPGADEFEGSGS